VVSQRRMVNVMRARVKSTLVSTGFFLSYLVYKSIRRVVPSASRAIRAPHYLNGTYLRQRVNLSWQVIRSTQVTAGYILGEFHKTRKLAFYQSRAQKKKAAKLAAKAAKNKSKRPEFKRGRRVKVAAVDINTFIKTAVYSEAAVAHELKVYRNVRRTKKRVSLRRRRA